MIRAPRGAKLHCKGWHQEAAMRMLMNNLDPEVAERPEDLVVYGGAGKAARNWDCYHAIVRTLQELENDETLLVQSGKPVGVFRTTPSPQGVDCQLQLGPGLGHLGALQELERKGLMMFGQMTAGSWIYIGTQGILQGTYETLAELAHQHFGGSSRVSWCSPRAWGHGRGPTSGCDHERRSGHRGGGGSRAHREKAGDQVLSAGHR